MPLIDTVLAGHLGAATLGAAAIGGSLFVLAFVAVVGLTMSLQPTVAALDGAGRRDRVGAYFHQAMLLGGAGGVVCGIALYMLGPAALRMVHAAPSLLPGAVSFLHAVSFAIPSIGVYGAARGLSEGLSRTWPTMVVQVAGLVLLAPLGATLMYGLFGAPRLGVLGSGIATAIIWAFEAALYVAILRVSRFYPGVDWQAGRWLPDWRLLGSLVRLGLPIALSLLLEAGMFSAAALIVASIGPVAAAGNQVAFNVVTVAFSVPLAVALAGTVRTGRAAGRRDAAALRRILVAGMALVAAAEAVSAGVLLCLPVRIARIYTQDRGVIATTSGVLVWGAFFQMSDGLQCFASGMLRGLKDTRVPMLIVAACYWIVGVPLGAGLVWREGFGPQGVWIGLLSGLTLAAILLGARLHILLRRTAFAAPGM